MCRREANQIADAVTILRTDGFAAKTLTRTAEGWAKTDYSVKKWANWREASAASLRDLAGVLASLDPREFVIRGAIHDNKRDTQLLQRTLTNFGGTRGATPRQWAMLDFDKIPLPPGEDLFCAPVDAVEWVIYEHLPSAFHDVDFFYQLSSSCGLNGSDTISAHIWFWLNRPVTGGDLADYLAVYGRGVDPAVLRNDVQPHFCAAPRFINASDPLPRRSGYVERGAEAVILPEFDRNQIRQEAKGKGIALSISGSFSERLARIGDGAGLAGFHAPSRDAIMAAIRESRGQVDDEPLKNTIRQAVLRAPARPGRDLANYLSDTYLDASIGGARRRYEETKPPPTYPDRGIALSDGEAALTSAINAFFEQAYKTAAKGEDAPVHLIWGSTGIGKSRRVHKRLTQYIRHLRKSQIFSAVAVAVPRHELGREFIYAEQHTNSDISYGQWLGREQDNPNKPGAQMCEALDVFTAATRRGFSGDTICAACPLECGRKVQNGEVHDVWFVAHQSLTQERPAAIGEIAAVIVDEDATKADHDLDRTITLQTLGAPSNVMGEEDRKILSALRGMLLNAIEATGAGYLTLTALQGAGLSSRLCNEAVALEYKAKPTFPNPASSVEQLAGWIENAHSDFYPLIPAIWGALFKWLEDQEINTLCKLPVNERCPHVWIERDFKLKDGEGTVDLIHLARAKGINEAWAAPTLICDATAIESRVVRLWPSVTVTCDVEVKAPHQRVIQILGRYGKSRYLYSDSPERAQYSANQRQELRRIIEVLAGQYRGRGASGGADVLALVHKGIRGVLLDGWTPPANVAIATHGAVEGSNAFEGVATILSDGYPMPTPATLEHIARVETGREVLTVGDKWPMTTRHIRLGDGTGEAVEAPIHPDPAVEALRMASAERALLQGAGGRGRGIRRTAANPLDIFIRCDLALPMTVDAVFRQAEFAPTDFDVAMARHNGVLPLSAAWLALQHPDLWANHKAAENAICRGAEQTLIPIVFANYKGNEGLLLASYKVASHRGGKPRRAMLAASDAAHRGRLAVLLGEPVIWLDPPPLASEHSARAELRDIRRSGSPAVPMILATNYLGGK